MEPVKERCSGHAQVALWIDNLEGLRLMQRQTEDIFDYKGLAGSFGKVSIPNKESPKRYAQVHRSKQEHASEIIPKEVVKLREEGNARDVDVLLKLTVNVFKIWNLESDKCKGAYPPPYIPVRLCYQNLNDFRNDHQIRLIKSLSFMKQIVSAMTFLHEHNIAHHDLKPVNILVTLNGNTPKVCDFCISRELDVDRAQVTVTPPGVGENGFKLPETYSCEPEGGCKTDIFSLGVITFYILGYGKNPFDSNPSTSAGNTIMKNNCVEFPQSDANHRSQLIDLLKRMPVPNPKDRPTDDLRVQNDLFFEGQVSQLIELLKRILERNQKDRPTDDLRVPSFEDDQPRQAQNGSGIILSSETEFIQWSTPYFGFGMPSYEALDRLRQKYGVISDIQKIKTLEHWQRKNNDFDNWSLIEFAENFTGKGIDQDVLEDPDNKTILRAIVLLIPKQKWMRFVRLELGLSRKEIKELHRQYAMFSTEQMFEILEQWFTYGRLLEEPPASDKAG